MSLVPFAMRVCTVRAIQAALPPEFTVLDSPQDPLDQLDSKKPRPVVAVYTGAVDTKLEGRNLLGGMERVLLAIQIFLPERFTFKFSGETQEQSIEIDCRRQGSETALDVIWRRIAINLNSGTEPWGFLWREVILNTPSMSNSSYLIQRESVKITAREIVLECEPIHEPIPGAEPYGFWELFSKAIFEDKHTDGLSQLGEWFVAEMRAKPMDKDGQDTAYLGQSDYVFRDLQGEMEPHTNTFPNEPVRPLFDNLTFEPVFKEPMVVVDGELVPKSEADKTP